MLRIEHVTTHLDILPGSEAGSDRPQATGVTAALGDPQAREDLKALVRETLRDYLRELERQGIV